MSEMVEIDAIGMRCPRPIVEIAKVFRKAEKGTTVIVRADDLAFESDVKAWCETTRNKLLSINREGKVFTAAIQVGDE